MKYKKTVIFKEKLHVFLVMLSEHLQLLDLPLKCFEFRITSGSPVYELFPSFF